MAQGALEGPRISVVIRYTLLDNVSLMIQQVRRSVYNSHCAPFCIPCCSRSSFPFRWSRARVGRSWYGCLLIYFFLFVRCVRGISSSKAPVERLSLLGTETLRLLLSLDLCVIQVLLEHHIWVVQEARSSRCDRLCVPRTYKRSAGQR